MTNGTRNLTIPLPDEEYTAFVAEAQGPPHLTTAVEYVRRIIRARSEMAMELSPDAEKLRMFYEIKIAGLESDKKDLTDRLVATNRENGLAGIAFVENKEETKVGKQIAQLKKEWESERQAEKLKTLEEQHTLLTARNKELEAELEELRETASMKQTIGEMLKMGGEAAGAFVAANPNLSQRVEQTGLAGLIFGGGATGIGSPGASLTTDQQQDLAIGTAIRDDFQGEMYPAVVESLRYFKANPGVLVSILRSPKFQQFAAQTA